ncbi:transposase [Streptomyces sp. NPDC088846]|uniref:IS110 family transposase n=1 Tax=unclassified Streptomyces TaxID=2593676 RepID=UPI0037FA79F4
MIANTCRAPVRRGRLPRRHRPRRGHGGHLADAEFTTTAAGYAAALAFLNAHGNVIAIGVEGTSSYGAGFTSAARSQGHQVVEVNRAERRRIGKSDPIDAYAAARAALSGRASSAPKDDSVAGIRALHNAARSGSRHAPPP